MAKHRLVNCDFLNAASFKVNISNKAKLLYLMMIVSADDKGFVDTTNDLISTLTNNEKEFNDTISLELLENTFTSALEELKDKGYIYEFVDNHKNKIHLIRHWFFHNKLIKGLWTNYRSFLEQTYLEENEYKLGKKPLKEDNNINQNKPKQYKPNKNNKVDDEPTKQELTEEEQLREELPFPL